MAPHDTNLAKQKRRHGKPLMILAAVVALVFVGFFWWVGYVMDRGDEPALDVPEQSAAPVASPDPAPAE